MVAGGGQWRSGWLPVVWGHGYGAVGLGRWSGGTAVVQRVVDDGVGAR